MDSRSLSKKVFRSLTFCQLMKLYWWKNFNKEKAGMFYNRIKAKQSIPFAYKSTNNFKRKK